MPHDPVTPFRSAPDRAPIYVSTREGGVFMHFAGHQISSVLMTPETARLVAQALLDRARELDQNSSPIILPRGVVQ